MWWRIKKLLRLRPFQFKASNDKIILITGCDSGFGFRAAVKASEAGFTVVAGLLGGPGADAAKKLLSLSPATHQPHILKLDITNDESVDNTVSYISKLLKNNPGYTLHSVVNNAGVMAFGEFEWQTQKMVNQQINVNVIGTLRMTKAVMPLLRHSSTDAKCLPRLVVIGSHCGFQPLPLLSIYSSTKFALRAWCDTLRMELEPHGIQIVYFIPGSMVTSTDIATRQKIYSDEMREGFDEERSSYYSEHFNNITSILNQLSFPKPPDSLHDSELMEKFMATLLDTTPDTEYKHQPWRYAFYYNMFAVTPMRIRHWLMGKFMLMPKFKPVLDKKQK